jgi:hypothetical protein
MVVIRTETAKGTPNSNSGVDTDAAKLTAQVTPRHVMFERRSMSTKEYNSEDIRFSWRLLAAPMIGQLIGLALGYLLSLDQSKFLSVWIGGAAGTCLGFWYGVWWHFKEKTRRKKKSYFTMLFIGIIANALGFVVFTTLYGSAGFSNTLDQFKLLQRSQISKITIMEEYGNEPLVTIDEEKTLSNFISACQDAIKYNPKVNYNPKIKFSCYVDLSGAFPYGLSAAIYEGEPNRIICTFAKRNGNSTSYHGTFESIQLRTWFDTYVTPKVKAKT